MQLDLLQEDLFSDGQDVPAPTPKKKPKLAKADKPAPVKTEAPAPVEIEEEIPAFTSDTKAPGAFKTISEVADFLGVQQHVLRFWESRFSQIKPLKLRGGRRYYRPEDIDILSTIKHLLYKQGYTINGAKKAFSQGKNAVQNLKAGHVPTMHKPKISDKQQKQLSAIREELFVLRETLKPFLPA